MMSPTSAASKLVLNCHSQLITWKTNTMKRRTREREKWNAQWKQLNEERCCWFSIEYSVDGAFSRKRNFYCISYTQLVSVVFRWMTDWVEICVRFVLDLIFHSPHSHSWFMELQIESMSLWYANTKHDKSNPFQWWCRRCPIAFFSIDRHVNCMCEEIGGDCYTLT